MKELRKYLKMARRRVTKEAAALPDQDAYATVYSIMSDLAREMDLFFQDIDPALKAAKSAVKKNPKQPTNRAKRWCTKP